MRSPRGLCLDSSNWILLESQCNKWNDLYVDFEKFIFFELDFEVDRPINTY